MGSSYVIHFRRVLNSGEAQLNPRRGAQARLRTIHMAGLFRRHVGEGPGTGSWFSRGDVGADDRQIIGRGLNGLFSILEGNESGVVIQSKVSFSPKSIEDGQQSGMFFVNALACKFDDRDMVARYTSSAETVAEHIPKRRFAQDHRIIRGSRD